MQRRISLLILLVTALAWSARADDADLAARLDRTAIERSTARVVIRFEPGELTEVQMDDFVALSDRAVRDVAAFTGLPEPVQRVRIYVAPEVEISHTLPGREPRMFISSDRVADRTAPYLHEMVHAVAGKGGAMWLEEGFASYVASAVAARYGGYYAPVLSDGNDGVDVQARDAMTAPDAGHELDWIRRGATPRFADQEQRRRFYILAHSFTKFLARHLGMQRLVAVHRANDGNALRREAGGWEREWLASLSLPPERSLAAASR